MSNDRQFAFRLIDPESHRVVARATVSANSADEAHSQGIQMVAKEKLIACFWETEELSVSLRTPRS